MGIRPTYNSFADCAIVQPGPVTHKIAACFAGQAPEFTLWSGWNAFQSRRLWVAVAREMGFEPTVTVLETVALGQTKLHSRYVYE